MSIGLVCWNCGMALADEPLPIRRLAECRSCGAELHVCRLCEFYDRQHAGQCREDRAEPPLEKTRANFCDYFEPKPEAYEGRDEAEQRRAREQLAALFGETTSAAADDGAERGETTSEAEWARRELERLFGARSGRED